MRRQRSFLIPEVVQSSAMDCGVAALKALFAGYGVDLNYGRLRDACQTDVDGTSIDTLEELSAALGLEAVQVIVPEHHALEKDGAHLPAIAVIRNSDGSPHYVVIWSLHGRFVQVMDPAVGRRWMTRSELRDLLFISESEVPGQAWRRWAGESEFTSPLRRRLTALAGRRGSQLLDEVLADPGWRALARLDAAARMIEPVVAAGALRSGEPALALLRGLEASEIPGGLWFARSRSHPQPVESTTDSEDAGLEEPVVLRGPVMVRIDGEGEHPRVDELPPRIRELTESVRRKEPAPLAEVSRMFRRDDLWLPMMVAVGSVFAAGGVLLESLLFRGLFELTTIVGLNDQRVVGMTLLIAFLLLLFSLEVPIASSSLRMGRRLELRFRVAFLEKLPRLKVHYFQSRPASDIADRSHAIHEVRALPLVAERLVRTSLEILVVAAALIWLSPAALLPALALVVTVLGVPLLAQKSITERELRVQTHGGAMVRYFLDALIGAVPLRTHGLKRSIRKAHESVASDWARASLGSQGIAAVVDGVQSACAFACVIWVVLTSLAAGLPPSAALLCTYWTLSLPALGEEFAHSAREFPAMRNRVLRLLDPLHAEEEARPHAGLPCPTRHSARALGVEVQYAEVDLVVGGHRVLSDVRLRVRAGEHVAIVGESGSGKSSLLRLLLGWYAPSSGSVTVDGAALTGETLARVRSQTAWVDPSVQLWNRPLLENLVYGSGRDASEILSVVETADLDRLVSFLPEGLQTPLGESGALVSGGEGQRVRFGRSLKKDMPSLVLLDEPFRGLDREHRRRLLRIAREKWSSATLLCVLHDIEDTRSFDRVVVVAEGRLVEIGRPELLLADSASAYAKLLAAESTNAGLWSRWRRLRMKDGHLVDGGSLEHS